ncbi:tyrosine-protein phosphatase [Actinoplanes aureus]|uniref:Tyrosine-protein phosphatase n=1 Tax=Actinoplanes aureus TaxID=2792083 RepID=A0A931C0Z5_9ACTN|nr:tyrosine-protein phosphatase [Actinoplanes aureus]MBG0561279.1 tyrosine-protein phosphatase [Actinoplanes aureus]
MGLDWPDCSNARDLGGTPTRDGRRIRSGALIRSDSHGLLTTASVAAVRALRPALILDLRWPRECELDPSPVAADPAYRNLPLLSDPIGYDPPEHTYAPLLDHNGERIADAFRVIAAAPPGAVLVHCRGGRDRTGALIALLLGAAGVAPETIAADFARTPGTEAVAMRNTLTHAEQRYGGVEAYLRQAGVPDEGLAAIRERLVEP